MAGHDSTAFYAASDPQIQVWSGAMYTQVEASAKARHKSLKVTEDQLNKEFWLLTKENYISHLDYHISRIAPHSIEIAAFSSQKTSKSDWRWKAIRTSIILIITTGLAIVAARQKRWQGVFLVGLFGLCIAILPESQTILTLAGALIFALNVLRPKGEPTYSAFALYWWIGVAVLYLVGGTWGPPLGAAYDMNALGYRVGSQFFFVNDLIAISALGLISKIQPTSFQLSSIFPPKCIIETQQPRLIKTASKFDIPFLFSLASYIFISTLVVTGIAGAGVVSYRTWQRTHETPLPFPQSGQFQAWWQENQASLHIATPLETVSNMLGLADKVGNTGTGGTASPYIFFTGGMSDFIWNLEGQMRSQAIMYIQTNSTPFTMFPNIAYVELPLHLQESTWARKQGVWVVRRLADLPPKSNLPFYFSEIAVKAFVPLSEDKKQFNFSAAQIFPLQKYASQLYASGELKVTNGVVEWNPPASAEKYPRRFLLTRKPATHISEPVALELNLADAVGARALSFKWLVEKSPNSTQPLTTSTLKVLGESGAQKNHGKSHVYYTGDIATPQGMQSAQIDLTQSAHNKLKLVLDNIMPDDKIWFYEFNMQSDEFLH